MALAKADAGNLADALMIDANQKTVVLSFLARQAIRSKRSALLY